MTFINEGDLTAAMAEPQKKKFLRVVIAVINALITVLIWAFSNETEKRQKASSEGDTNNVTTDE
jgi:4-amino-4-deoxy-L-arabinose transferase-like glycosyltransferase